MLRICNRPTKKNCHLNCLLCRLSGCRELVASLVHVSGESCVSHDAARSVLLASRATLMFLNVSSVPVFGLFSAPLRRFLLQRCARGLSLTYLTRSFVRRSVLLMQSLSRRQSTMFWCQDLEQDGVCQLNNFHRVISVIRCAERCDATRSTCVLRDAKYRISNHPCQIAELSGTRVLLRFWVSYRRVLCCSPIIRVAHYGRPLLAELCRGALRP